MLRQFHLQAWSLDISVEQFKLLQEKFEKLAAQEVKCYIERRYKENGGSLIYVDPKDTHRATQVAANRIINDVLKGLPRK